MLNIKTESPFVLFSSPRSGTTTLIKGLSMHPDCFCHREIFLRDNAVHKKFRESNNLDELRKDPINFVNTILNYSENKRSVGFKMWCYQNEIACNYLLKNPIVKKIILERENRLASYSSGLIRKQTGIANATNEEKKNLSLNSTLKLEFLLDDFINYLNNKNQLFNYYSSNVEGPCLYIKYSELNSQKTLDGIASFLGIDVNTPITLPLIKINDYKIIDRFDDKYKSEIINFLEKIDKNDWIEETIDS